MGTSFTIINESETDINVYHDQNNITRGTSFDVSLSDSEWPDGKLNNVISHQINISLDEYKTNSFKNECISDFPDVIP